MKIQPAVWKETAHIAIGAAVVSAVVCAVYAALGRFGADAALGCLVGGVWTVVNFFALGVSVQIASATGDDKRAKLKLQLSYSLRMLVSLGALVFAFTADAVAWPPVVILYFAPRLTIFVMQLTGVYKPDKANRKGE